MSAARTSPAGFGIHQAVLAALLAGVLGLGAWLEPAFVGIAAQLDLATHSIEIALLALPMTLIIVGGGIDLSVGSTMALAAVVIGLVVEAGAPIWLASAAAVLVGLFAGMLNGVFVAYVRVHPLIVTLATLAAYRGLAEGISLGRPVSGFPEGFQRIVGGTGNGIPLALAAVAVIAIVFGVGAWRSIAGFWVYAVGDSERAARYGGIPVARMKFLLYTVGGAMAGLAAVLFVARRNTAKADIAMGIELDVITAVVLGGTSITGGRGSILGTMLGVALLHEARELASWHWQHEEAFPIVVGGILIGSVLLNNVVSRRRA